MGHRQAAIQMYAKLLGNINKYFQNDDHCQPGLKDFVGEKHCQKSTKMSLSAASQRKCVARLNSVCLFHRFKIRALIHNVAEYINGWGCCEQLCYSVTDGFL